MNGTNFSEAYKEQIKEKEMLLDMIKRMPMTGMDLRLETNFDTEKVSRYLVSLKYYKLISQQTAEEQPNRLLRKWYAISDAKFEDMLMASLMEAQERRVKTRIEIEQQKRELEQKKIADNGVTIVKADDYHTRGNKSRVDSWSGYTSF